MIIKETGICYTFVSPHVSILPVFVYLCITPTLLSYISMRLLRFYANYYAKMLKRFKLRFKRFGCHYDLVLAKLFCAR